ncbi:glucose-6-phosphate dehydrogenase [Ilumatobacter coccineus]|jgi:glucose-6-phosphate 1-dehydrogenase|uniref:Glucose-6-phosphate 1-dehydrogenase n=1 Tax=Ilumatobacter coccineus (strain NBRC 103263 / KCTC 29153 / YM16-304) TaxID=1313172 RepID=A0A6C7E4K7_ILUCY|nr:glucose-6-phosphate dehydrogenase [Ilumatobacter coccineus]BAN01483.1 glucose-6-phosphate 1-dehydrogenase [Ilumatobacter coccineus YM16-304]
MSEQPITTDVPYVDTAQIDPNQPEADALVLFGATGDLAKRKLFPSLYKLERSNTLDVPVIGVARSDWTDDDFRTHARESIEAHVDDADDEIISSLSDRLDLIQGDYADEATWEELRDTLDRHGSETAVFYMAIPPSIFPMVAEKLASVGLNERGRIVVEKPFGRDLDSAVELNQTLHSVFPEDHIFRIDHYLGKEAVEDLLVFRFANTLLEPVWNRNYVRSVQVTMSETIGVEGRGSFYEGVGAIRDVLQNHLLQVIALLAMEPPAGPDARFLQDEKAKVISAMRPIECSQMVRGQYVGYRDEDGVADDSSVETFAAVRLEIDSWRWAGVPWYVRVGKGLAENATEAVIELREPPRMLFDEAGSPPPERNLIRLRLGKNDGVTFALQAKTPGPSLDSQEVDVDVDFAAALGERQDAYERLLGDALVGSLRRFARQDVVEGTWAIVQPALDEPGEIFPYFRDSWGPSEADNILEPGDHWYPPSPAR